MTILQLLISTSLTFLSCYSIAQAGVLRCDGSIIDSEDTESEFQTKCGEPMFADDVTVKYVRYVKDDKVLDTDFEKKYLIDHGSSSSVFLVRTKDSKVKSTEQVYLDRDLKIEKCSGIKTGTDRIVFDKFCGQPFSILKKSEKIPAKSDKSPHTRQTIEQIDEVVYKWGDEKWELTFSNQVLTNKKKI
ncbi:MAG: DUF2845 domain-containing protein [Proteobacteria bacterium]|nr:DUF2845 domain-containing protein [Pseudomonadota bacterium]